ncbi:hypothetical protein PHAVU_004G028700 [Phaseolus vulgaris]|uniref:Uncharacterized protein n=1 Tax=Phaseolus vulgaris TaxID=3885 RepID=V7C1J3_PHAVU|nr:hypothetical protein PHAVU_004G028700g [Phaseolus vulgaris]ESW23223.1 hypothetical protein PHAVU_004G028700g [Phaseolus vulgaris]
MGDNSLVPQMIEKVIIDQISSLGNSGSLLRMLVTVDSKPTILSEQSIVTLGHHLSEYLMDNLQAICYQCTKNFLNRVNAFTSVLWLMLKDSKFIQIMSFCKENVDNLVHQV